MTIKTTIHYYRLDISEAEQAAEYRTLCDKLSAMGLKLFASISSDGSGFYRERIAPLNGQTIELETKHLFNNQWNTAPTATSDNGLRVFDWAETIVPNRSLKIGMWLEQTDEMDTIRRDTLKCGYCGSQHHISEKLKFCPDCLDSPYLKESDLHLLRLIPVALCDHSNRRPELTDSERHYLLPRYVERQTTGKDSRAAHKRREMYVDLERDLAERIEHAQTEHDAFKWLLNAGLSMAAIENCIYYRHTGRFCFGWRVPVSSKVKSELENLLCEFPFDYDIKGE